MNWIITLENGTEKTVKADMLGVSQTGDLIAFSNVNGAPTMPCVGYAAGEWKSFCKSSLELVK